MKIIKSPLFCAMCNKTGIDYIPYKDEEISEADAFKYYLEKLREKMTICPDCKKTLPTKPKLYE